MRLYSPRPSETLVDSANATAGGLALAGQAFAIVDHGGIAWGSEHTFAGALTDRLAAHGAARVECIDWEDHSILAPPEFFDEIAARVAGAVTGIGQ
jgi:hypothetical protein